MEEKEIDFLDYLRVLRKRRKMLLGVIVGFFVVSLIISFLLPPVFQSSAIIEAAKIGNAPVEVSAVSELLFKNPVNPYLKEIAKNMNMDAKEVYDLPKRFEITDRLGYIQITGNGKTPEEVKKLLDTICVLILERQEKLVRYAMEISNNEMATLKDQLVAVKTEVEQLNKKTQQRERTEIILTG